MDRLGKTDDGSFTVLEFYSGIGGMRFSLVLSGIHATIIEAFDINNIANEVYRHNFGHSPCQTNIESLTTAQLDKYKADAWLLSPPCQPYTRQGLQKDAEDARASSFLKIIQLIPLLQHPPTKLFVENVVGFESSVTHKRMMEVLEKTGFTTQEFILSPLQFGVPYSRPRYFCLAKKAPLSFPRPELNGQLVSSTHPLISGEQVPNYKLPLDGSVTEVGLDTHISCKPIKDFLESDILRRNSTVCTEMNSCRSIYENMAIEEDGSKLKDCHNKNKYGIVDRQECLVHFRDFYMSEDCNYNATICEDDSDASDGSKDHSRSSKMEQYSIPVGLIERWGEVMDIVFPDSIRCCCFTKSYGRYIKGTGSFLVTAEVDDDKKNMLKKTGNKGYESKSKVALLQELDLRYFTPREVANFHSFPEEFNFPNHFSLRQRYSLLGNSLSVAVVAPLLKYLFSE